MRDNLDGSTPELLKLDGNCEIAFGGETLTLRDAGHGINPDHPVMEVTWYGAASYCDWLSLQSSRPRAHPHSGDWTCDGGNPYFPPVALRGIHDPPQNSSDRVGFRAARTIGVE